MMSIHAATRGLRRWLAAAGLAAALASALAPSPGSAQQQSRTITFQQALQLALSRNSAIRTAENATEQQAVLPSLQLSTSGSQSVGRGFSQDEGQIVTTTTQSFNAGLSSGVTLFDGFRNIANLRSAQLGEDASQLTVERTRQTVALAVATGYIALAEAEAQVHVRQEALAAEAAAAQQVQVLVDAGSRPIADLYQQQASEASARAALVQAERDVERARTDVLETLQLDAGENYEFVTPTLESVAGGALEPLDTLINRAVRSRADLDAQAARVAAAEQSVRAAAAARWPTISLNAGYNTGATSMSELSFADQLNERRGGSVGISVSVPIFDRLSRQSATEQAEIAADNASIALEAQRRQVGLEVRRAWVDYQAAAAQVSAAEAQLRAAELALAAVTERYRVGAATLVEVSQARATQVQAASALVTGRNTLVLQRALIAYYTGELDPESAVIGPARP
jgi:outer membrane protein